MDDPKHNQPPIADRLAIEFEALSDRVAEILTKARDEIPVEITTDEQNSRIGDLIKGIRSLTREIGDEEDKKKRPHLDDLEAIRGFFRGLTDRLAKGKSVLEARGKKYLDAKAEAERARREEAARIAREEEARRLREAEAAEEQGRDIHAGLALDAAADADRRAALAEDAAGAKAAELARTRMAGGGVSTLATKWSHEIVDLSAIPLEALRPYLPHSDIDKAVRGFVRAGGRQLKGVRIFEITQAQYR